MARYMTDKEREALEEFNKELLDSLKESEFKKGDEIVYGENKPGKVVHVFDEISFMNPEVEYKIRYQSDGGTTTARVRGKDIALKKV